MRCARWRLASRCLAAALGGYALANTLPVALVAPSSLARVDAALVALQLSFVVYTGAVVWAFAARSAALAWAGLALAALLSSGLACALL